MDNEKPPSSSPKTQTLPVVSVIQYPKGTRYWSMYRCVELLPNLTKEGSREPRRCTRKAVYLVNGENCCTIHAGAKSVYALIAYNATKETPDA